ncbi:uncharacterized protein SETTUDRAFT_36599 [Exserohilum turcica Et28A]|uniref:SnoaL-like domain-containing protein n=1 Tax=Exserohilum turcicum (strain 28A) TaxID=671987 RepID=R0J2E7_EXST2|nr:uncharacterized protein SETTUDRAFT_36599 [Exserohilum turcica Et28A]EOA91115.1 hypothetical protein SETTUDRAFT_36599 [Exserohilum turcica Et28A]
MAPLLPTYSGITKPATHLTEHEGIADDVHRITESVDAEDGAMFESCVFPDAEWDVSGLTFLEKDYGVLRGLKEMLHWQMTGPAPVLTTHMATSIRSHITILEDGTKTATCTANILAQHLPHGTPHDKISTWEKDVFLAGNRLSGELKWDGERWRFTRLCHKTIWSVGDNSFIVRGRPKAMTE